MVLSEEALRTLSIDLMGELNLKALIIVAGKGSRLQTKAIDEPKPLTPHLGASLIERVMSKLKKASID